MSEWVKTVSKSKVPDGSGKVVAVDDKQVALFHVNGHFYAIDNTCPHRGGPLGEGEVEGTVVTCPWHGWEFDVTTGVSPINPAACVKKYELKEEGEDIFLSLNIAP